MSTIVGIQIDVRYAGKMSPLEAAMIIERDPSDRGINSIDKWSHSKGHGNATHVPNLHSPLVILVPLHGLIPETIEDDE